MIVHPELHALRSDDAPQRFAQRHLYGAMAAWRSRLETEALIRELARLDAGEPIEACALLDALFTPGSTAGHALASTFVAEAVRALGDAPLAHMPMRHFTDGCTSTLLLGRSGGVTLTLIAIDGSELAGRPEPRSISFAPVETWEMILAGQADADLISCQPSGPQSVDLFRSQIALRPKTVVRRNGMQEARLVRSIAGTLVAVRLQRRSRNAGVSREYSLTDGALVHQAAGNPRDSRIEMMLALLGRMQRADAAPLMADLARSDASAALRWQALRECLALDTRAGFEALSALAADSRDPLAGPAGALHAQLLEAHPQLQELAVCPA